jgi:protein tyrosine phosphatase
MTEALPTPTVERIVDRRLLRSWLTKLANYNEPLSFSDSEELRTLLDMYDSSSLNPLQFHLDSRFKNCLPLPDANQCNTACKYTEMNRTTDNYPTDEGLLKSDGKSYFNASVIEGRDRVYIATQHPLPSTMLDFWKMVLAEKPCIIVMLNKYDYDNAMNNPAVADLVQYWPGDNPKTGFVEAILLEDSDTGGTVKISIIQETHTPEIEEVEDNTQGKNDLDNKAVTQVASDVSISPVLPPIEGSPALPTSPPLSMPGSRPEAQMHHGIECSKLLVECMGQQHQVWHIRCNAWKDQDAPDIDMFMDLWKLVEEKIKTHTPSSGDKHKIVVHCTGGVGRTGTFITIDIAGQELKAMAGQSSVEPFSIDKVIRFLRKKRMNMVGSASQYVFCHRAILKVLAEHSSGSPPASPQLDSNTNT